VQWRKIPAALQDIRALSRHADGPGRDVQRACPAVRSDEPAPSPTDIPSRQVKSAGAIGVEGACHGNHVIHVVVLGQASV
jgi:hypothetical protein